MATERSRQLAAQAWCTGGNKHKVMDPVLCEAFADILDEQIKNREHAIKTLKIVHGHLIDGLPTFEDRHRVVDVIKLLEGS